MSAERDVLSRERSLKSSAPGGTSHTAYKYAVAPDGNRYIVGAEVLIITPKDAAEHASSGGAPKNSPLFRKPADTSGSPGTRSHGRRDENSDVIKELEQTEREVIAHENAHKAAAGRFGGPVHYSYTTGPDGKRYISGGEVPIHTPATNDPEEALRNARQVMSAALAPGDPSSSDIAAAAGASAIAASARARLAKGETDAPSEFSGKAVRSYRGNLSPNGLWISGNSGAYPNPGDRSEISLSSPFDTGA